MSPEDEIQLYLRLYHSSIYLVTEIQLEEKKFVFNGYIPELWNLGLQRLPHIKSLVLSITLLLQAINKRKILFLSIDVYQNSKKKEFFPEQAFITYRCE